MDKLHKALAVAGVVAMIAIPIVGHSVYGGNAHVQVMLALLTSALGVVGFTAAKPLFAGDPQELQRTHKTLAVIGMMCAAVLPMLGQSYADHPAVKLGIDIAVAVLNSAGFIGVRPLAGAGAAAIPLVMFLAASAAALTGCAPGTDGLRQACANIDQVLASSATTATAIYRADQRQLRARITHDTADAVGAVATAHDEAFDKLTDSLDAASAAMAAVCALPDAIDAGLKKDLPTLIAQAIKIGSDVAAAVAAFKKAIAEVQIVYWRFDNPPLLSSSLTLAPAISRFGEPFFSTMQYVVVR